MRVIVSDIPGTEHAEGVRAAIIYGYNALYNKSQYPDIDISHDVSVVGTTWEQAVDYAKTDPDVVAIARSTSGIKYFVSKSKEVYPRVQSFVPMGSNVYYEIKIFADPEPPIITTCGCGDDENRNNTAYGNGLEFWEMDWTWYGGPDASSFANGWIVGKMLRLYDELRKIKPDATWWHARSLLRETAWREEENRPKDEFGNPVKWCKENGYGHPNLDAALEQMLTFVPPSDPYLPQVTLGNVGKARGIPRGAVKIQIDSVENAILYTIIKNGKELTKIKAGHPLEYTDVLDAYGTYYYSYYAEGSTGRTTESNTVRVLYARGYEPRIIYYNIQPIKDME